jgi:hypothetical protein
MRAKPSLPAILYTTCILSSLSLQAAILDDLVEKVHPKKVHTYHKRDTHRYSTLSQEAQWQTSLKFLGYYKGKIDGDLFTEKTFNAVTAFHHDHGQIDTGFLEEEDKRYLSKIYHVIAMDQYLSYEGSDKRKQAQRLQAALKVTSYYRGKIDGYFKKASKAALSRYQTHLESDLDPKEVEKSVLKEAKEKVASDIEKIKQERYNPENYQE